MGIEESLRTRIVRYAPVIGLVGTLILGSTYVTTLPEAPEPQKIELGEYQPENCQTVMDVVQLYQKPNY